MLIISTYCFYGKNNYEGESNYVSYFNMTTQICYVRMLTILIKI